MSDRTTLVQRLRSDADWHHRVTGASVQHNPMSLAADELDRLNAQALELCAEISGLRRELGEARAKIYAWLLDEVQHIGDWDGLTDQERKELADLMMTRCPLAATKEGER